MVFLSGPAGAIPPLHSSLVTSRPKPQVDSPLPRPLSHSGKPDKDTGKEKRDPKRGADGGRTGRRLSQQTKDHAPSPPCRRRQRESAADADERHREQPRERQHDLLQVGARHLPRHDRPDDPGRDPAQRHQRWHQPQAVRPRRTRGRHRREQRAGVARGHQPPLGPGPPGQRLLHGALGRRGGVHPRRRLRPRRERRSRSDLHR